MRGLLIRGKITDFIARIPFTYPILPIKCKIGIEIEIIDDEEKELLTKKYLKKYKIPRSVTIKDASKFSLPPKTRCFDISLRKLFQEIIDDELFMKAIAVLEIGIDEKDCILKEEGKITESDKGGD